MRKKVLITRSKAQNHETAFLLAQAGHEAVECSLVEMVDTNAAIPSTRFGGIIFTSQVAVQALERREVNGLLLPRSLKVFAVGEKTAQRARKLGFENTITGNSGAESLGERISNAKTDDLAPLLYLAGVDRAVKIDAGKYKIQLVELYRAELIIPEPALLQRAVDEISNGCALLYSVRTATHLIELISRYNLEQAIENVPFIAISKKVADAIASKIKSPVLIARQPNQMAMIDMLKELEN